MSRRLSLVLRGALSTGLCILCICLVVKGELPGAGQRLNQR